MTSLNIELVMLLWSAILYIVQIAVAAIANDVRNGIAWGLGNRDNVPLSTGWVGRSERAYRNMAESLLPFACLIVIIQASGTGGEWSALGASVFFFSRLAYAALYLAGVTVLRSLAYFGGMAGIGLIIYQIF